MSLLKIELELVDSGMRDDSPMPLGLHPENESFPIEMIFPLNTPDKLELFKKVLSVARDSGMQNSLELTDGMSLGQVVELAWDYF